MMSNIMEVGAHSCFTSRPEKSLGFDHDQLSDSCSKRRSVRSMTARIESFPTRSLRGAAQLQNPSFLISHMLMVSDTSILPVSSALVAAGVWLAGFPEGLISHSRCPMYLGDVG